MPGLCRSVAVYCSGAASVFLARIGMIRCHGASGSSEPQWASEAGPSVRATQGRFHVSLGKANGTCAWPSHTAKPAPVLARMGTLVAAPRAQSVHRPTGNTDVAPG